MYIVLAIRDLNLLIEGLAKWRGCYVVKICDTAEEGLKAANEEEKATGNKYQCIVLPTEAATPDSDFTNKVDNEDTR